MTIEFVVYRGVRMIKGWPERIQAAQVLRTIIVAGSAIQRVPYGAQQGTDSPSTHPCHDCRVFGGELHVPRCDVEQCPNCQTQLITCDCLIESPEYGEERSELSSIIRRYLDGELTPHEAVATLRAAGWGVWHRPEDVPGVMGPARWSYEDLHTKARQLVDAAQAS